VLAGKQTAVIPTTDLDCEWPHRYATERVCESEAMQQVGRVGTNLDARADLNDLHGRDLNRVTGERRRPADVVQRVDPDLAIADRRCLGGCSADVQREEIVVAEPAA